MQQTFDLVVVIPVGPSCSINYIADTIKSFVFYTKSTYKIIIADDSQIGTGWKVQKKFPDIDIIKMPISYGKLCGLYISLSLAYRHAIENFKFTALLRLDTDALVIGREPEKEALELFRNYPTVGIAGQYRFDYNGKPRDIQWPRQRIINSTQSWKFFRRPFANMVLRHLYKKAVRNGYSTGENVFGGAYFISEKCLIRLKQENLLPETRLKSLNLEEDHLFGLLVKSVGMDLSDLSENYKTFGCAWKGLPAAPEQLAIDGKKIVHSTRFWQSMKEDEIRNYFREKRESVI